MPFWLELVFLIGFPLAFVLMVAAWIIDHVWLTPKEAKILKKAARKKKPVMFLGSDDGYADVEILDIIGKGGYGSTSKDPKKKWTAFFARSIGEEEAEQKTKEAKIGHLINKLASRKLFLRSAKVPIWFGYSGKAILTSLYSLIGVELTKEINPNPNPIVNLTEIKSLFPKPWDESQQRANEVDAKTEGLLEGKKFFGMESWKPVVMGVSIILALGIILVLVLILAPKVL